MSPAASEYNPDCALRVLAELEHWQEGNTGALVYGDAATLSGVVLLEQGRVCWAVAKGLRKRLTELLRDRCVPEMSATEMEALFLKCKDEGKPVGEALVEMHRISAAALREVLRRHTAESLCTERSWDGAPRWVGHRSRGYQSAYTFLAPELLAEAGTIVAGEAVVERAQKSLVEVARQRDGAVFDRTGSVLLAIHLPGEGAWGVSAVRDAGGWAAQTLRDQPAEGTVLKFAPDQAGGLWLAWRQNDLNYVVHSPDRVDFSTMVRTLHPRGITSAVQSSVPLKHRPSVATH